MKKLLYRRKSKNIIPTPPSKTPEAVSKRMKRVGRHDTKPELQVRHLLISFGYQYLLNVAKLPGSPDIVFWNKKKVILVHGCFWHGHSGCRKGSTPKTNRQYWLEKINTNRKRDHRIERQLRSLGWGVMTIWECQIKDTDRLKERISRFLQ